MFTQLKDVLTVPALWAFLIGIFTKNITLPETVELGLPAGVWFVIASALLLVGIRRLNNSDTTGINITNN
ncbi:hypothetical protein [Microcoleus anatoxicus]|uniref:Uncharacterized protein n=1 Tax=Microcoleus anatoxicus PTRS2 TaxID=2705321 RepID=A0ABU8YLC8_9CYAN